MRNSKIVWLLAGLGMLLALLPGRINADPAVGHAAPKLVAVDFNGNLFDLAALHGKVVVVHFWATWCPPCRAEMPELEKFTQQFQGRGAQVIAVCTNQKRDRKEAVNVMKQFSFPSILQATAKVDEFGMPDGMPMTYVVDTQGVIRAQFAGGKPALTVKALGDVVTPLLPDGN